MILTRPLYQPVETLENEIPLQPCVERMAMMVAVLGDRTGTLVDLGCHTGWFCRAFSRLGWDAIGIDQSADWIEVAISLRTAWDFDRLPAYRVANLRDSGIPKSDVALCLSMVMYLFQEGFYTGWTFLQRVSDAAPMMFLDFGGMYAKHLPFTEETAIEEIVRRTSYKEGRLLGHSQFESRPLFLFTR